MDVNENIANLAVRIQNTTEDVNGAVLEIDGKVNDSNQDIADLDRQFKKTTEELNRDVLKLDEKFTNADLDDQLNATTDDLNDLDGAVTGVEEKIKFLKVDVLKLDEKFTNANVEVEGKVAELNEEIADLGGQLNTTTDDLNDLDKAVTGLEEKVDGAVLGLEEKVTGAVTGLEEKIKLLEEALEVALKIGEIQFRGVASQSSTYEQGVFIGVASNCIDGMKESDVVRCHTRNEPNEWWKLTFTKDVVINRIMIYNQNRMQYIAGKRVSILSSTGNIVWESNIGHEEKPVYVIGVPNVVGQYVKIDKGVYNWIVMKEVVVFGRYD